MIPRLWYLTDGERGTGGRSQLDVLRSAAAGGVGAVVLREHDAAAREVAALVAGLADERRRGLRVLVSRRVDLCLGLGLDGVHLARDAMPVPEARRLLGRDAWVGYSAHSGNEARAVAGQGADYVTLSPIFATDSKPGAPGRGPDWLRLAVDGLDVPALALGGVTPERSGGMVSAGAWGVAAISAIGAAPDVRGAARAFVASLGEAGRVRRGSIEEIR